MSKHTPGPWSPFTKESGDVLIRCACPGPLENIVVASVAANPPSAHYDGNARLIAAAPEMLGALQRILGLIEESDGLFGFHLNGELSDWSEHQDDIDAIQNAIANATGEEGGDQ